MKRENIHFLTLDLSRSVKSGANWKSSSVDIYSVIAVKGKAQLGEMIILVHDVLVTCIMQTKHLTIASNRPFWYFRTRPIRQERLGYRTRQTGHWGQVQFYLLAILCFGLFLCFIGIGSFSKLEGGGGLAKPTCILGGARMHVHTYVCTHSHACTSC